MEILAPLSVPAKVVASGEYVIRVQASTPPGDVDLESYLFSAVQR